ncbi:NUDIX domain-containing protein [Verrucomicrobium sp. 3C]|uniref:NUDIX domain-containing protein n=1 Tax=Verrucomicrobium sp. 3C TaxID=1134055 RepID=UPI001E610DEC|nr:NUDIX domain-containing protein [Verrucomicrobium sp. 3C]
MEAGEEPLAAAARELAEETGVAGLPLWEVGVFGKPGRDPRGPVVSVAHVTWADPAAVRAAAASDEAAVRWFPVTGLPLLAFDHAEIIPAACRFLEEKLASPHPGIVAGQDGELLHRALARLDG